MKIPHKMTIKRIAVGLGKYPKKLVTPRGPHKKYESYALTYVIRDLLKFADNSRETDKILREGNVVVDGRVIKDGNFGIGLMDVLSFPKINKHYLMMPSTTKSKNLSPKEISEDGAKIKLAKVTEKQVIKDGKIQISTGDGYIFSVNKDENKGINTKDTIVFDISAKKRAVREILKFKEGAAVLITQGRNKGNTGKITRIDKGTKDILSTTKVGDIKTSTDYVLVIGKEEPLIQTK
ncbi:MAG: hypothetical protein CVT88_05665 [Candidatus Altiarchaeales archaeon HGW-Altiarchaeales-1]|nr:MAG: hypothetical protein CVT88_05665 [Candidatus Altiarchaeales archaeon HGW-Altiarchaeales-1]